MAELDHNTEQKILDAANKVFVKKGFDGTRMQQIADEAKINKSLLHYYYRSKDKLFYNVFKIMAKKFFPQAISVFSDTNIDFFDRIRAFTNEYISILSKNPFLPNFILHELSRKSEKMTELFTHLFDSFFTTNINILKQELIKEHKKGRIIKIEITDFIVNILSLSVFPFVSRSILKATLMDNSQEKFGDFIEKRKTDVAELIINSIKIK